MPLGWVSRDKDGEPLVKWRTPEECFDGFKAVTRGRPCDYSGLTYDRLRSGSGIQWPCNDEAPDGTERLYTDHRFNTDTDYCEDYGHDLTTGAAFERKDTRRHRGCRPSDPQGRASPPARTSRSASSGPSCSPAVAASITAGRRRPG